jgi:hypothetical protein
LAPLGAERKKAGSILSIFADTWVFVQFERLKTSVHGLPYIGTSKIQ